ncbi:MAG: hypothetical protein H6594_04295 [Flavobacteriales bacterium]|nr:hypothetical protein [Flavobacteriales bacterium]
MIKRIQYLLGIAVLLAGGSGCYYDVEEELYPMAMCDTSAITYAGTIEPLIATNCATPGCHVPGGTGPGDFTNYNGVKQKVDNGTIAQRVLVQRDMPPTTPLSDCELQQIDLWIKAGAPNN